MSYSRILPCSIACPRSSNDLKIMGIGHPHPFVLDGPGSYLRIIGDGIRVATDERK